MLATDTGSSLARAVASTRSRLWWV